MTYIIFDGDNDKWAYGRMKGWKSLKNIDFDFDNAHDIYPLTDRAKDEAYIKAKLKKRFSNAKQVIVIIGKSTKFLYKYVRWELEVAQQLDLPIIAVNLNGDREQNILTCPPIIRDTYTVHIPFRLSIIKHALESFPNEYRKRSKKDIGSRYYEKSVYKKLGLSE